MSSEADTSTPARSDPPDAAIRAELERILASDVFSRSRQLRRFLSFIVEQRLAGQGHALKESVLAHELYGKGTDFDGGTDPVVRVDARRVRDKLREYYERRREQFAGKPWRDARDFENAYKILLFQDMIEQGERFGHVDTPGGYIEVDTQQDFEYAQRNWVTKHWLR